MKPIEVRWRLRTPVVLSPHPLHLDGLLALARARQIEAQQDRPWSEAVRMAQEALPLGRWAVAGQAGWQASMLEYQEFVDRPVMQTAIRKTDPDRIAEARADGIVECKKNVIALGTGPQRNYDYRYVTQQARQAVAWAIGDPAEVYDLLEWVDAIGGKARNGWGLVRDVAVEEVPESECRWWWRHLPKQDGISGVVKMGATVPPYWARRNWEVVVVPEEKPE